MTMKALPVLPLAVLVTFCPAVKAQPAKGAEIDLRLFARSEVDLTRGCSVALWQANRDPERDGFAYVFVETIGAGQVRQPARIKIGKDVLRLKRVATGGKASGYGLHEYQLYRMETANSFVVLELKLADIEGEAVEIEGGSLNVYQPDKVPMRVSVKGGAGCFTPASPPPAERIPRQR